MNRKGFEELVVVFWFEVL